jgi:hypothetical protein
MRILGACGVAVLVIGMVLWMFFGPAGRIGGGGDRIPDISGRFPKAPVSYGVLPAGAIAKPDTPSSPAPPFSWVGKRKTTGLRFVASKRGRYFYPIAHSAAQLIRDEDFVGYGSIDEARADGKIPLH